MPGIHPTPGPLRPFSGPYRTGVITRDWRVANADFVGRRVVQGRTFCPETVRYEGVSHENQEVPQLVGSVFGPPELLDEPRAVDFDQPYDLSSSHVRGRLRGDAVRLFGDVRVAVTLDREWTG